MSDWAIYWQRYLEESGSDGEPVDGWLTSRDWLIKRLQFGDRIWLFIGGDACGDDEKPQCGYIAALLVVEDCGNYDGHQPGVAGSPRFRINGITDRCVLIEPPILFDKFLRPTESDQRHIGLLRQTPLELDDYAVKELLDQLKIHSPDAYSTAMPS